MLITSVMFPVWHHQAMDTSLGAQIRQARLQRGWSQTRLAEQLGTSKKTVGMWERGGRISPLRLARLQQELGIDVTGHWTQGPSTVARLNFSADAESSPVVHHYSLRVPMAGQETPAQALNRLRRDLQRITAELDAVVELMEQQS